MAKPLTSIDDIPLTVIPDFELSVRGKIDEKAIRSKIEDKEVPLIIDMSIMGYSNKGNFKLEQNGVTFTQFKNKCVEKATDGDSLTLKRACRVCRKDTHNYIITKNKKTPLYFQYSAEAKVSVEVNQYSFIGGEHMVPAKLALDLYNLWVCFDKEKKTTKISESVKRVLEAKYGEKAFI